jgi:hypothetical protein
MYKTELDEVEEVHARRKERDNGTRHVLKDKSVVSSARVERVLTEYEATNRKE